VKTILSLLSFDFDEALELAVVLLGWPVYIDQNSFVLLTRPLCMSQLMDRAEIASDR